MGKMSIGRTAMAWAVHVYTALGAAVGFLALQAAFAGDDRLTFLWLAVAFGIDASDGALARWVGVKRVLPWIDGTLLDNIIDYLTYVVVPVAVFVRPGILPAGFEWMALSVLLASAYGFSRTDAKGMIDHYFQGFPSYWNIMALYMVVLGTSPGVNLFAMLVAVVLVFVPMRWLYPSRMERGRAAFISLGLVWSVMSLVLIVQLPEPSYALAWASLFYPILYTAGSVVFHFRS
jgi:phosphatidylcholine synthase